tara:strand:+ start:928 stop:1143 length:216 start_codon:yes stop_codon:yes gene_type:complete
MINEMCSTISGITGLVALYATLSEVLPFLQCKSNGLLHTVFVLTKHCIKRRKEIKNQEEEPSLVIFTEVEV